MIQFSPPRVALGALLLLLPFVVLHRQASLLDAHVAIVRVRASLEHPSRGLRGPERDAAVRTVLAAARRAAADPATIFQAVRALDVAGVSSEAADLAARALPLFSQKPLMARWALLTARRAGRPVAQGAEAARLVAETSRVPAYAPGRIAYFAAMSLTAVEEAEPAFRVLLRGLDAPDYGEQIAFELSRFAEFDGKPALQFHFLVRSLAAGAAPSVLVAQAIDWYRRTGGDLGALLWFTARAERRGGTLPTRQVLDLVSVLVEAGKIDLASAAAARLEAESVGDPLLQVIRARVAFARGEYARARTLLEQFLRAGSGAEERDMAGARRMIEEIDRHLGVPQR